MRPRERDMEDLEYLKKQEERFLRYEAMCKRCGKCCGVSDGDPCVNLDKDVRGSYYCRVYLNRVGPQKTLSGRDFNCAEIRENMRKGATQPNCAYSKIF